jgi:hypothetical protein
MIAGFRHRPEGRHVEAALAQRTRQTHPERRIIVQNHQAAIFERRDPWVRFNLLVHSCLP